jgi:drug/metabolite transporter (DMT)-like permease
MDTTTIGELAAICTAFIWTLAVLSWTSAGKEIGSLPVSFIRMLIACVYLSAYGLIVHRMILPLDADWETWLILGASGFFGFFIADVCLFKAFLLIGPRLSLLIQTLSPPLSQIIAWMFMNDKLAMKDCVGMAVTLMGVVWVVLERPETKEEHARHSHITRGVMLALVSAVMTAIGSVLSKIGIGTYDAVSATYIRVLGSIIGYVFLITALRRWPMMVKGVRNRRALGIMMFGCFCGPFVGVALSMVALRNCHVGIVNTIISTMPVIILPFVIFVYHERVSVRAAAGAILSIVGVAIMVI